MTWSVCIFAHNEENHLPACLGAIESAAVGHDYKVHILENGSTDRTTEVARTFVSIDNRIAFHELPVADKANTWNEYIHRISGSADMHIFLDGDIRPGKGSFKALQSAFEGSPEAYGAAAIPASGRSRKHWARRLFENHYLSGNLYALTDHAVDLIRKMPFHFPFGAVGEDGLLSYLLLTDLKGGQDDSFKNRICIASGAHFEYESLMFNPQDINIFKNRLKRYSKRYIQNQIMYPMLKQKGISSLPEKIETIFTTEALEKISPRKSLIDNIADRHMLQHLKQQARSKG